LTIINPAAFGNPDDLKLAINSFYMTEGQRVFELVKDKDVQFALKLTHGQVTALKHSRDEAVRRSASGTGDTGRRMEGKAESQQSL
jgi:hypothetical protein